MIQRRRGERPTEAAFHAPTAAAGSGLHLVRTLPHTHALPLYGTDEIRLSLLQGEVVVVVVHGPPYVGWQQRAYPDLRSRHGQLCAPGEYGGPLHAVMLTRLDEDDFLLLDPYLPVEGQPLRMTRGDFEQTFAGHAVAAQQLPAPTPL